MNRYFKIFFNSLHYLSFQDLVHAVGFQQAVVGVGVKVDGDILFEGGFELGLQCLYKLRNPLISLIVFVAIGYKNVVFVTGKDRGH